MNMKNHAQLLKLVAIMRGLPLEQALKATEVLAEAGIRAIEITFNTQGAADTIKALRKSYGDDMIIGAGTVTTTDQLACAIDAGASFILAPDCNPEVIRGTKQAGLFSIPGAMTPTEIQTAVRAGADMVKLFPAASLGTGYLKNILAPLNDAQIMVVGGVDSTNVVDFFKAGAKAAGIGSCLVNKAEAAAGDYSKMQQRAEDLVRLTR